MSYADLYEDTYGTDVGTPVTVGPNVFYEKLSGETLELLTLLGEHIGNGETRPIQLSDTGTLPDPPSTPLAPLILDTSTMTLRTSATIDWEAPDNTGRPPITGYVVQRSQDAGAWAAVSGSPFSAATLTLTQTGLATATPEIVWEYRVAATNADGQGEWSNVYALQWQAAPLSQPTAPTSFARGPLAPTAIDFTWAETTDATIDKHGIFTNNTLTVDNIPASSRSYTWGGLNPNTTYSSINVRRHNASTQGSPAGWSPASNMLTFTTSTTTPPPGGLLSGQVQGKVVWGMATDNYAARVAETGPVGAEHSFVSTWNPSQLLQKANEIHDLGVLPYLSMKVHDGANPVGDVWGKVANGLRDASCTTLANDLNNLGFPIRLGFHHEPGVSEGGTLQEWVAMQMRLWNIIRPRASNVVLGPIDNGFKWSNTAQGYTDQQLNYYTDAFLNAMDAHGADYYDGMTPSTNGERAEIKARNAEAWMVRRGFGSKPMDCGEWNFVRPSDCTAMFNLMKANPAKWWCAIAFNSDNNNRTGIPTIGGGWNFTHDYQTNNDRLNAFKAALADSASHP